MVGAGRQCSLPVAVVVALLWTSGGAMAEAGEITGHVIDAQGQPLQGVTIKLLEPGEKEPRQQASGADGSFRFEGLDTKIYIVNAAQEGYSPVTCPGFRLMPDVPRSFEIQMMPAEGEQSSSCKAAESTAPPPGGASQRNRISLPAGSTPRSPDPT